MNDWLHTLVTYQNKKQNFSCTMGHWRRHKIPAGGVSSLLAYAMLGFSRKRCFRQTEFQSSTNCARDSSCSLKKQATVQMTDTTLPAMFLADQCISLKQQVMETVKIRRLAKLDWIPKAFSEQLGKPLSYVEANVAQSKILFSLENGSIA